MRVSDASAITQMEMALAQTRAQTRNDEAQKEKRSRPVEFDATHTNDFVRRLQAKGSSSLVNKSLEVAVADLYDHDPARNAWWVGQVRKHLEACVPLAGLQLCVRGGVIQAT